MSKHVRHNRAFWDADADTYQAAHGEALARTPMAWGAYRAPEAKLGILGETAGRDVLELGCGAAQWSIALAEAGAHAVALDVSAQQLIHARSAGDALPVVQANGEELPFADETFDIVFCDHGATSFCEPSRILPEAARVLRDGGLLAFSATHPLLYLTWDDQRERQSRRLHLPYAQLGRMASTEGTIDWVLPAGDWIRCLRAAGFDVEDCIELCADVDADTTFTDFAPPKWARQWPAEWIWRARKRITSP